MSTPVSHSRSYSVALPKNIHAEEDLPMPSRTSEALVSRIYAALKSCNEAEYPETQLSYLKNLKKNIITLHPKDALLPTYIEMLQERISELEESLKRQ